eukprot:symbB.v1.2.001265.t1/scaffold65.1/size366479/12
MLRHSATALVLPPWTSTPTRSSTPLVLRAAFWRRSTGDSLRRPLGHWSPARAIATLRDVATRPFPRAGRAWPARRISTETPGDETSQKPTIRRLMALLWPDRALLSVALCFLVGAAVSQAFLPHCLSETLKAIIDGQAAGTLGVSTFSGPLSNLFLAAIAGAFFSSLRGACFIIIGARASVRLRQQLLESLLRRLKSELNFSVLQFLRDTVGHNGLQPCAFLLNAQHAKALCAGNTDSFRKFPNFCFSPGENPQIAVCKESKNLRGVVMPESSIHDKCRPASNRLKKLQALRKQALQRRFGHASDARRLFVERAGGSAAKAAGRRRLAPVPSDQDWERLKDEEGRLNDALLDFHLDRLAVLSSVAGRVHAFSSLFFTRLMEGGCKQVSRWTRSLRQKVLGGIFSKEVIFVPAHDSNTEHWWLALIVYPWAAARITENGERLPSPSGCKAFIAFLDSIDPRLGTSFVDPEDEQAAQQAAACAQQRHEKALKLLREYLKHEWLTCFGGAGWDYCEDLIEGISLEVPQQTNTTDCGVYVLEYARRLLDDPRLLDHVCTHQASPPLLVAPVSRSLRQRWQKLGERSRMTDLRPLQFDWRSRRISI